MTNILSLHNILFLSMVVLVPDDSIIILKCRIMNFQTLYKKKRDASSSSDLTNTLSKTESTTKHYCMYIIIYLHSIFRYSLHTPSTYCTSTIILSSRSWIIRYNYYFVVGLLRALWTMVYNVIFFYLSRPMLCLHVLDHLFRGSH